jgi:hypothetical protein
MFMKSLMIWNCDLEELQRSSSRVCVCGFIWHLAGANNEHGSICGKDHDHKGISRLLWDH